MYLNISGVPRVANAEIMTFFQLAPLAIRSSVRLPRIILLFGGGLRPVASSGKEGPVITASHRDCRDRLTHENVIRISLLPTALRNDCSTSLCNVVPPSLPSVSLPRPSPSVFPEKPPPTPSFFSVRLSREIQHEVGQRSRDRWATCHKGLTGLTSSAIDICGGDRNWFLEMRDCARPG